MTVFSISDIPEFTKKQRIVVVGVIGKSPYRYPNKATPLLPMVQSNEVSNFYLGTTYIPTIAHSNSFLNR